MSYNNEASRGGRGRERGRGRGRVSGEPSGEDDESRFLLLSSAAPASPARAGPSWPARAGPSSAAQTGPSPAAQVRPSSVAQAVPFGAAEAVPFWEAEAGPSWVYDDEVGPSWAYDAGADEAGADEAGPVAVSPVPSSEEELIDFEYFDEDEDWEFRVGTPDADTVPNSPSSMDSNPNRLSTSVSLGTVCQAPTKRGYFPKDYTSSEEE